MPRPLPLSVSLLAAAVLPLAAHAEVSFSREILPILSDKCFYCHGQDENHRKGDRRLDTKEDAFADHDGVRPVVAGHPEQSDLIARIFSEDADEVMPPKKEAKRLTPEQKQLLKQWVAEGAKWGTHWAFTPPARPEVPAEGRYARRNEIDSFIQSRLEKEGLAPAPEADRRTLLRRLSLDLTGLPPTLEEQEAFLHDPAPGAWERQVERLLSSPHYGEHWGRDWLDLARYADTNGYEKDAPRSAWFYRDWVIGAFNRDLPYDQFIVEQLAGDLLPGATQDQRVATGFLRNSMINEEGGVDPEQFRMEAMFDRMDALGKGVLGLTIQCAQCHSHKFDPITHTEYYGLFSFLNRDEDAQPVVLTREEQAQATAVRAKIAAEEEKLRRQLPDWPERMARWEAEVRSRPRPKWTTLKPEVEDISTGGQKYLLQPDGSFLAAGFQPVKHEVKMTVHAELPRLAAFRLEALNDVRLPAGGPGRSHLGTFGLTEFRVEVTVPGGKPAAVKFARAAADLEPAAETPVISNFNEKVPKRRVIGPASYAIDGSDETAWSNDLGPGRRNQACLAVFIPEKPVENEGGSDLTLKLSQKHGGWNADDLHGNNLGRFRLSVSADAGAETDTVPTAIHEILDVAPEKRSPEQKAALFTYWRTTVPEAAEANTAIDTLWKQYPEGTTQLTLTRRETPRETHLLKRGDWLKPAEVVPPGTPAVLHPYPADAPRDRLGFARWLMDRKSPTVARVLVNRLWQHYFGIGLVATAEDFGLQSEAPSHPELLDWLACELMDHGWSIRHVQRLIVNSGTYRQNSTVTAEAAKRDPYNRLLARGPRFRVGAETVRDIQLAASGLLNLKMGGRGVMPPAPAFLFLPPASYAPFPWKEEADAEKYRRAVYIYRRRTTPYPMLTMFDTPEATLACTRRNRSDTPLQALTTLNETTSVEAARALARRALEEGGATDSARLQWVWRRCVGRPPRAAEETVLQKLLAAQTHRCSEDGVDAWLIATGNSTPGTLPEKATPAQLAAWTVVSRVLLNLDETITKE